MRAFNNMRSILDTTFYTGILKRLLSFLLLVMALNMQGQTIASFEYYFGPDPGIGSRSTISADTNTGELTQDLVIDVTGLNEGFHKLSILAIDSNGEYSLYSASDFYIFDFTTGGASISDLDELEYWFDADPGFGLGTTLSITGSPIDETTESFVIPLGTLSEGFHTLGMRAKSVDGTWSLFTKSIFYIFELSGGAPISDLTAIEYWFGADPGLGNGDPLSITGNPSELTESYAIPLGALDEGFQTISIRAQNLDGDWSLFDKKTFYVSDIAGSDPISNLQKLEYWFDTDPGFGNGTEIAIAGAPSDYTDPLVIPLGSLDGGFHELGIRAQNLDGTWSLYERKRFFIIDAADFATPPAAPLDEIEFLYDAELGFGTGTPLGFTPTGNPDEYLVEIPTDLVTCDFHDIWISMKNTDGSYSLYSVLEDVEVFDNADPTIVVFADITVELDALGQGSITIADVDNGTFDDCELVSVVLDQPQFDYTCADLGANTVMVTATDAEMKVSTQNVTITVVDNIDPVAVAQDLTISLDANGMASITANDLEDGSTDNCSIVSRSVDITDFDCTNLGPNTVNFTVTDPDGNTNSVSATVTVEDNTNPNAITQNLTVQLDATGAATIVPDDVDLSTDNCTIVTKGLDIDTFDCTDLGDNTVTLTVTDQSGNSNTATATITVEDNIDPVAVSQNITVQLNASGNATILATDIDDSSSDNCNITNRSLDISSFDCSNLGDNTVTLTVTDQSGNSDTATATVTVEDVADPTAVGQNITVQLDASGSASITALDIDNGSNDNCTIDTRSLDITDFDCGDVGANTVTLTVTDTSGNSNSTTATVTVEDNIMPTVTTQDLTVQLDASGTASIVEADIENSLSDNCGIASSVLDITSFDCSDLGANTVNLTVTDVNGNVTNTPATVTVEDSIDPVAVAQDITVQLDGSGNASIVVGDVENGSSDNCSIVSSTLDVSSFDCSNVGANSVTLTVTDQSGNTDTATITVTVEDIEDPVAVTQDITVGLDASGSASIIPADIDNGSSDNCTIDMSTIDITSFGCSDLGANTVTLTVTDSNGLTDSATATVTVEDNLDPSAIGMDITVDLLGMPSVSIVAADVDDGSGDNCGSVTLSIDVDTFTMEGVFPVVLTVTDAAGNTDTVTINVTVTDSLSIDDEEYSPNDIRLYPNPASDRLYFDTDLIISKVQLVDLTGKLVLERINPGDNVVVENLQEGVYFVLFDVDGIKLTKRFIKH
ncbi:T9SS type A sorting domain-containing protein [Winogradskyella vincentii]|uniref:T9SS type A sorting domain-containing protein n=1 Tax=Winogradskyella vincentii TaxID=2877122 RepID=A0ABS7Y0Y2_9FLAO|nr:T9SS type A sorting domain-containing protein [Winogradskyella vincentii]MCA0153588.1 T9SS type A sorting domain-containing protein [Winogradskyella vincentii]